MGREVGATPPMVNAWANEKQTPSTPYLLAMVEHWPGLNGHWLLTGDGEMVRQEMTDAEVRLEAIRRLVDPRRPLPDEDALFSLLGELPDRSAEGLQDVS